MTVGMNCRIHINSLKIPPAFESIPMPDCLTDGFLALNSVMPDSAGNYFTNFGNFVVAPNGCERTAGDAVRCLQHNRACAVFAKEFFDVLGNTMEIILRPARRKTASFGLLEMHNVFNVSGWKRVCAGNLAASIRG